jgi:predicted ATPase
MSLVVREIHASSYRSLRSIRFPTGRLTVFVGPNGVGKTNLYRVLQLLQAAAGGTLSRELAAEGGMQSALWAGRRRAGQPARIVLSAGFGEASGSNDVAAEAVHSYEGRHLFIPDRSRPACHLRARCLSP